MSYYHEKSLVGQHAEHVSDAGSARSGSGSGDDKTKTGVTAEVFAAQDGASHWVNGTPEEKRLVRKLDWRILPCTWTLYLLGFLDRANIG